MYKELPWYFNGTAFNKLVYDAGYNGIKDFAERSGISISYKTIKRACSNGHCTKRTFHAIAVTLGTTFEWKDPIGTLKTIFEMAQFNEEKCNNDMSCLVKEFPIKYEEVVVCLTNDHCVSVKGKSICWSWVDYDNTIAFYDKDECDDGELKIAEFDKAAVLGIIRQFKE